MIITIQVTTEMTSLYLRSLQEHPQVDIVLILIMVDMMGLRGPIQWYVIIVNEEAMSWQNARVWLLQQKKKPDVCLVHSVLEPLGVSGTILEKKPSGTVPAADSEF